jgi:hypothetical protein
MAVKPLPERSTERYTAHNGQRPHISAIKMASPVNRWNSTQQILESGNDNDSGQKFPRQNIHQRIVSKCSVY